MVTREYYGIMLTREYYGIMVTREYYGDYKIIPSLVPWYHIVQFDLLLTRGLIRR